MDGSVDPVRDAEVIETELLLKDAETVDRVLEKLAYATSACEAYQLHCIPPIEHMQIPTNISFSALPLLLIFHPRSKKKKDPAESLPGYKELMEQCRAALDADMPIRTMLASLSPDVDATAVKVQTWVACGSLYGIHWAMHGVCEVIAKHYQNVAITAHNCEGSR